MNQVLNVYFGQICPWKKRSFLESRSSFTNFLPLFLAAPFPFGQKLLAIVIHLLLIDDPPPKVHCQWGSWESTGGCSRSCGGGTRTKIRSKTRIEVNTPCSGLATKVEPCNTAKCQGKSQFLLSHIGRLWCTIKKYQKSKQTFFSTSQSWLSMECLVRSWMLKDMWWRNPNHDKTEKSNWSFNNV